MNVKGSVMKIPYETAKDAARGIRNEFYTEKDGLHLRVLPYNRFDVDEPKNWWWLSPSNELVAHEHGKFLFTQDDDGRICVGLAIEKGLGDGYAFLKEYKQWTMDKSWQWHKFYADVKNGEVDRALHLIQERSGGAKPLLLLDWNNWPDKPLVSGKASFEWDIRDGLKCMKSDDPAFSGCKTLVSIQAALDRHITEPNSWCDFRVMLPFDPAPGGGKGCWKPIEIKQRLLEPFEKWVV